MSDTDRDDDRQQHTIAIEELSAAWDRALERGVNGELLVSSFLAVSVSNLVRMYGKDPAMEIIETLPGRIHDGDFDYALKEEDE